MKTKAFLSCNGLTVERTLKFLPLQLSSWSGLKAFMDSFSQKDYGPIPRSIVAHTLAPLKTDPSRIWTPTAAMLKAAMGLPKPGLSICRELDSFLDECCSWVLFILF